ncbi:DUF1345 domain-containing protein [Noviherbaspirillum pedocola]|uniref:DUF1345 domain-containing protein n=1 Tax=Noviherbaspirillum pedocola TaxID=2801341 RepID=A0A934SV42_9BURK|nr:DUF1345 domain-containing protein [Noviherbaspirillum pedocola]MBK4733304.1 DUF1345 domain-containing protein [Noviherbaspirillum pedocola]
MILARHLIRSRPRLSFALATGIVVTCLLPAHLGGVARGLVGWNVVVWTYLLLVGWLMGRSDHHRVRAVALQEDQTALAVLALMSLAAVASVVAIVFELASAGKLSFSQRLFHYLLTGCTVLGSWGMVATIFTFHYAVLFYKSPCEARALGFPDHEPEPNYWDFLYFSFTIAVAAQTSDISVLSRPARKAVLAQSVLAFFFNAAILGLSVNIAASAVGS